MMATTGKTKTAYPADAVHIIGGGLAGCEAAWQAARRGCRVVVHEMRPQTSTPAHKTGGLAELVCSNSMRSDDYENNAVGVLHQEMRLLDSLIMQAADASAVPAGGALAVDRHQFSATVESALNQQPNITIARGEVASMGACGNWQSVIVATGPLTSPGFAASLQALTGTENLAFFDAIAPIVHRHSINMDIAWFQSRYDKGAAGDSADYINCPMDQAQYTAFITALLAADKTEAKDWEKDTPYFEGCQPLEVMAARGVDTPRFGPMKPVGLTDPKTGSRPYAVVQLRQDNALATLYNMVGFQTKLKYGEQARIFRMIPGLEAAEFARLGGLHRNSFIRSPLLLDSQLRLKAQPNCRFAGQITGVEGYVESAAMGGLAGIMAAYDADNAGADFILPPATTAHGALLAHITGGGDAKHFQPMNINFGLFPPMDTAADNDKPPVKKRLRKANRKQALAKRALADMAVWAKTQAQALTSASAKSAAIAKATPIRLPATDVGSDRQDGSGQPPANI